MKRVASIFASVLFLLPVSAFADVVFNDGTFNLANYSESTQFASGTVNSFLQCASCGNPDTALQINTTAPIGTGSYSQAFINNTFAYNPLTQGAISSISASVDKNINLNYATSGFGNTFRPTIEQDGLFYAAAIPGPTLNTGAGGGSSGYNTLSQAGLLATNFQEYDFTTGTFIASVHPNFAGDSMLLGLTQITTIGGGPSNAMFFAQYDNLHLDLAQVPEPTSLVLLGSALLGFGVIRRRRHNLK